MRYITIDLFSELLFILQVSDGLVCDDGRFRCFQASALLQAFIYNDNQVTDAILGTNFEFLLSQYLFETRCQLLSNMCLQLIKFLSLLLVLL